MQQELDCEFMKNCGTCGTPVADTVEKCFKCGSPITNVGGDGAELMQKFGRGGTVHRVASGLDKRNKVQRKKSAHTPAGKKRKTAKGANTSAEAQQLAQVAGGSEGDMAARILRELIDEGAIGSEKRRSAEQLVGELGGSLPPPRKKAVVNKRPRRVTRKRGKVTAGGDAVGTSVKPETAAVPGDEADSTDAISSASQEGAASPGPEAKLARLKELGELHESGIITAAEFQSLKKQIIG